MALDNDMHSRYVKEIDTFLTKLFTLKKFDKQRLWVYSANFVLEVGDDRKLETAHCEKAKKGKFASKTFTKIKTTLFSDVSGPDPASAYVFRNIINFSIISEGLF